jgi:hypothetical protein
MWALKAVLVGVGGFVSGYFQDATSSFVGLIHSNPAAAIFVAGVAWLFVGLLIDYWRLRAWARKTCLAKKFDSLEDKVEYLIEERVNKVKSSIASDVLTKVRAAPPEGLR